MHLARAVLIAYLATVGWFIWAISTETSGSCFGASHYVTSAVVVLVLVVVVQLLFDARLVRSAESSIRTSALLFLATGAGTAGPLVVAGLLAGGWLAAAASCSA